MNREPGSFDRSDKVDNPNVGSPAPAPARAPRDNPAPQWHAPQVTRHDRQRLNGHRSGVLWFTGLSAAGKSTIANLLAQRLHAAGVRVYVLDGDNFRHGLSKDLGFSDADRAENIRRAAEVARLMVDAGVLVISAFISPFHAERRLARDLFAPGEFFEVFIDAPLSVAESRDPKGLYRLARSGALPRFTGIDSAYEVPLDAEVHIDTTAVTPPEAAQLLHDELARRGMLDAPSGA